MRVTRTTIVTTEDSPAARAIVGNVRGSVSTVRYKVCINGNITAVHGLEGKGMNPGKDDLHVFIDTNRTEFKGRHFEFPFPAFQGRGIFR